MNLKASCANATLVFFFCQQNFVATIVRLNWYNILGVKIAAEVTGAWWRSWSSKPVQGRMVLGGFDSHSPPPFWNNKLRQVKPFILADIKSRAEIVKSVRRIWRP